MDRFTRDDLNALIADRSAPTISIYTTTHPGGSPQDTIRWKHQLDAVQNQLADYGIRGNDAESLLAPARNLLKDLEWWKYTSAGLATFISPHDLLRVFRLPIPFSNEVKVGPRFQIKPLLPWLSGDGRFYVLALSQNQVRLYEGSAHGITQLGPGKLPPNMETALQTHDRDDVLNMHSHPDSAGKAMHVFFHGHAVGIDDHKQELTTYFQKIDHALNQILQGSDAPLVVASVDYLLPIYRKVSKYPHIVEEGIKGNPDHWNESDLHKRAWAIVGPIFAERIARVLAQFRQLDGTGKTSHHLGEVLAGAASGELEVLLLKRDQAIYGRFDAAKHMLDVHPTEKPGDEDLTNLAAVYALRHGRTVHVVDPLALGGDSPVAGIFFVAPQPWK